MKTNTRSNGCSVKRRHYQESRVQIWGWEFVSQGRKWEAGFQRRGCVIKAWDEDHGSTESLEWAQGEGVQGEGGEPPVRRQEDSLGWFVLGLGPHDSGLGLHPNSLRPIISIMFHHPGRRTLCRDLQLSKASPGDTWSWFRGCGLKLQLMRRTMSFLL